MLLVAREAGRVAWINQFAIKFAASLFSVLDSASEFRVEVAFERVCFRAAQVVFAVLVRCSCCERERERCFPVFFFIFVTALIYD